MWIVFYLLVCLLIGLLGKRTNIGFWGFTFFSILFSPFIGFFILTIAGPKEVPRYAIKEKLVKVELEDEK